MCRNKIQKVRTELDENKCGTSPGIKIFKNTILDNRKDMEFKMVKVKFSLCLPKYHVMKTYPVLN
jgi:hypothetical protein